MTHPYVRLTLLLALLGLLLATPCRAQSLVPATPSQAPDYFCTWNIQGYCVSYDGDTRGMMTEANLFGGGPTQGWAAFYPRVRQDLTLLLDDSWNMPLNSGPVLQQYFGLVALDAERFPTCTGSQEQRLAQLDRWVRSLGWRGVGGWVCAQESPMDSLHTDARAYWQRQFALAHRAGMHYLKVDFGHHERDVQWRLMLSEIAHQVSPQLVIEHAQPKGPTQTDTPQLDAAIARCSDVFRTYDVETFIAMPITLRRVVQVLDQRPQEGCRGIVNCEDEPYLAVGLGCAIGIMRHPLADALPDGRADQVFPTTCRDVKHRQDEVVRAVRWHRVAEPFGMNADLVQDTLLLTDRWLLGPRDTWFGGRQPGDMVTEHAPARIARAMPLPTVQPTGHIAVGYAPDGTPHTRQTLAQALAQAAPICPDGADTTAIAPSLATAAQPYVLASRYPSGATAVVTLERLQPRLWYHPLASVDIQVQDLSAPVGIFGYYHQLTLTYPRRLPRHGLRILAQDLAGDTPIDITRHVTLRGRRLIIPGHLITQIGLSAATPGDRSAPGLILQIQAR